MNIDENKSLFRESMRGFNKDDVAAFIKKLSKDYADNEDKYKERIVKLTAENKAHAEEIEHLAAGSAAAVNEAQENLQKETERFAAQLNEKNSEIENLNNSLKSSAANIDKYKDDVNRLLSEARSKDTELIELKKNAENSSASEASEALALSDEIENLKIKHTELLKNNEDLKYRLEEAAKIIKESRSANDETVNELSEQVAELSAGIEEMKCANQALEQKNDDILRNLDALTAEKDVIIEDLQNQLEQSKSKTEDEQKMYENITADLGSIIYSAKKSAEDITSKAKSEAEDLIARANIKKLAVLDENEQNIAMFKEKYEFIRTEHEKVSENFKLLSEQYSADLLEIKNAIEEIDKNIY
jgi:cell division septum initiation protein DivIVA